MDYKNYNMKDKFDETAEVPFNEEYEEAEKHEPVKKKKMFRLKINPIKRDKYSRWYIVLILSPIFASILSLIKFDFVHSAMYLIYSILPFLIWNNMCFMDRFLEDDLVLSNFRNLERAFLKTSKLKSVYMNIEDIYTFSKRSIFLIIFLSFINQIINDIFFLNFIINIILFVLMANNLIAMQIMSLKGYDDDMRFVNFIYKMALVMFFVILIIKFAIYPYIIMDYNMLFVSCFYYTLKVYIAKK